MCRNLQSDKVLGLLPVGLNIDDKKIVSPMLFMFLLVYKIINLNIIHYLATV